MEDKSKNLPDQGAQANYLRDQVLEQYRWSRDEHEHQFCEGAIQQYKLWMNHVEPRLLGDYRSNIGVPVIFPIIETAHAHLMSPWTQARELITCTAIEEEGVPRAPLVAGYINNKLRHDVRRSFSKTSLIKKSGLVFARGISKIWPRGYPKRTILQRIPVQVGQWLQPGGFKVATRLTWSDIPPEKQIEFGYVDPFDMWWTPGCRFMEDADWTFERYYLTHQQVLGKMNSGEWQQVNIQEGDALGYDDYRSRRSDLRGEWGDQVRAGTGRSNKLHRVIEAQGQFKTKESGQYETLIVIIVDERVMVTKPNDRLATWNGKPSYNVWEPTLDPGGQLPISMIHHVEDVLHEINDFENIGMDNARKIVESVLLVDHTKTKQKEIFIGPGEINFVRDPAFAVKALEMKDLPPSFYQQIGFLFDLVQKATGISDYFSGSASEGTDRLTKTAKGMQLMANLAASRLQPMLASMDSEHYQPLAESIHETAKQRMKDPVSVPVTGNTNSPFSLVGPDELDVKLNYSFNTKALDPSAAQKRQEFLELSANLTALEQPLLAQGYQLDLYEMVRLTLDLFDRGADIDKIVKELPQMAQQAMLPAGSPEASATMPMMPGAPQVAA